MIKSSRKIYPFYVLLDLACIAAVFTVAYILKYSVSILGAYNFVQIQGYSFIFVLWATFIISSFIRNDLYYTDRSLTIPKEMRKVISIVIYSSILVGMIIFFAQYKFFSRQIYIFSSCLLCLVLSIWRTAKRIILRKLIQEGYHNINLLIVGAGKVGELVLEQVKNNPVWGFRVVGFLDDIAQGQICGVPVIGKLKDLTHVIKRYFVDEVIIALSSGLEDVTDMIRQLREMHIGVRVAPDRIEDPLPILSINYLGVVPLFTYKERKRLLTEIGLKRFFDFFVSFILLILLSPLFILIAIVVKLDSDGSVFYVQKRAGFKGRLFNLYKFRSMVNNADKLKEHLVSKNESADGIIFKIRRDPRITIIGKFLRKHSLDELPQLFNVLKGDMSIVGSRPPTPDEVNKYNHDHMQRLSIRPGITGLSQVRGRSELTFRKWVKWDIWYINNWSFGLDLKIIWWTIPAVLKGKGAY